MSKAENAELGSSAEKRSIFSGFSVKGTLKRLVGYISDEKSLDDHARNQGGKEIPSAVSGIERVIKRVARSSSYAPSCTSVAPYGKFYGRPIIGDCTPVLGGIYLSAHPQEATVVDEKYGLLYGTYAEFREMYINPLLVNAVSGDKISEDQLIQNVLTAVRGIFEWSQTKVDELNIKHGILPDQKVALDIYVSAGVGVARHHVLMAAYLIERLKQDGRLKGCVSVDTILSDERLMYTSRTGDIYIVDFAKSLVEVGH